MPRADSGYEIVPACLTGSECDRLREALSHESAPRTRAGARHLMSHRAVRALANSDPLVSLARQWLGGAAIPFRATLFEKSRATNWLIPWHQDTALPMSRQFEAEVWGPWSRKAGALYAHAPAWALSRSASISTARMPPTARYA